MTQVKKVNLATSKLSLTEFTQCMATSLAAIDNKAVDYSNDTLMVHYITNIRKHLPSLEANFKQIRTKTTTAQVKEADKSRLRDFQILNDSLSLFRYRKEEDIQLAYKRLKDLFTGYRELRNSGYEKRTALIKHLLEKVKQEPYKADISLLKLTDAIKNLSQSQAQFYPLYLQHADDKNTLSDTDISQIRQLVQGKYQALYTYLLLLMDMDAKHSFAPIFSVVNDIRIEYHSLLAKQKTKAAEISKKASQVNETTLVTN